MEITLKEDAGYSLSHGGSRFEGSLAAGTHDVDADLAAALIANGVGQEVVQVPAPAPDPAATEPASPADEEASA